MGAIASQLPAGQDIAEGVRLKRQEANLISQMQAKSALYNPNNPEAQARGMVPVRKAGEMLPTYEQLAKVKQRQFEMKPTAESWQAARTAMSRANAYQNISRIVANRMTQNRINEAVQQRNDLEQRLQRLRAGEDPAYYGPEFNKLSEDKQREVAQQLQTIRTTGGKR